MRSPLAVPGLTYTDVFAGNLLRTWHISTPVPDSVRIRQAVAATLLQVGSGELDASRVAVLLSRDDRDDDQTRDYVNHLFREARHVCRHQSTPGHYRLHIETRCGPLCDERYEQAEHRTRRPACPDCHLEIPTSGVCGNCEAA